MTRNSSSRAMAHAASVHFARWRARFFGDTVGDNEMPLRAELFNAEQMEHHGQTLAHTHVLDGAGTPGRLLVRLEQNDEVLAESRALLRAAVKERLPIAPAGEWLLDNYYLIEEQIRTARLHLPKAYSRELPRLAQGPSRGLPRVYDLALEAISHGDGRVDAESLHRFVAAYQSITPLKIGELWAIPIMLRLALIENLRRVAARIMAARLHLNQAHHWASQMMDVAERDPKSLILVIADMARSDPPMASAFVAELARHLQGHGPALALALNWIEQRLAEASLTIERMVQAENQQQAADQVSISRSIGSLRFLGAMDWRGFVEDRSLVEQVLRAEPQGTYAAMDFATRDRYRHVIERLSRGSHLDESTVAASVVELARRGALAMPDTPYRGHLGFYLIDEGRAELEAMIGFRVTPLARVRRALAARPLTVMLGAATLITTLLTLVLLTHAQRGGVHGAWLALLALPAVLGASQFASSMVNWIVTLIAVPRALPRMDYSQGLPEDMRSLVVMPTMLLDVQGVDVLVEKLEVHFIGNQDARLHFALLTDFADAASETCDTDEPLLRAARNGIEALNRKYPSNDGERFFLLHRARRWNAGEGVWMGYERKRGKLADLNRLLRDGDGQRFALVVGDIAALSPIRHVITLDTDTELPRDAARAMVATLAHPLNRACFDAQRRRVTRGYGILQPRMGATLAAANRSHYAELCSSEPGIDPYTRAASDVYQDLFHEGSFIGKGIYDVDAFESALADRLPENRILSHDLLEGCYARSGLLNDVHLYEEYPPSYAADVKRQRRWIRGDWQVAHWLLPWVPDAQGQSQPNPLSLLSRWKIADNLRRHLALIAILLLLIVGWVVLPAPGLWTCTVLGIALLPPALMALLDLSRKAVEVPLSAHLLATAQTAMRRYALTGFHLVTLPYEAWFTLRAMLTTAWRMLVTRKHLLEWQVSGQDMDARPQDLAADYRRMAVAPLTGASVLAFAITHPSALPSATPLALLWLLAPYFAWRLSVSRMRVAPTLTAAQTLYLRRIARKTWAFFEHWVGPADHWLPPDNYQLAPGPILAHRTSPTNIGLGLLANLAALDFAFISTGSFLGRTANSFATMSLLARHQGHFFNWYDTRTLQVLPARYVSAVDSGNLVGHLLTLRAALVALPQQPLVSAQMLPALHDTLALLIEATPEERRAPLARCTDILDEARALPVLSLQATWQVLQPMTACVTALDSHRTHVLAAEAEQDDASYWLHAFARQCRDLRDDLVDLIPWLSLSPAPPGCEAFAQREDIHSLRELADARADLAELDALLQGEVDEFQAGWLRQWRSLRVDGATRAIDRIVQSERMVATASNFATMDFRFLYDSKRHLLAIGYNVDEFRRDESYYDLLASEARLGSFVAIAQGQLPQESWFALGRRLTTAGGAPVLASWSGSMFEYLMPLLVMPNYPTTLLDQTCRAAVARQIAYGQQRSLPWGVSESGYNTVDANLNYQYHAFGVPGLGLKRGLGDDAVIAPYATVLALMVAPQAACANLERLVTIGMEGRYGFFEAIDYTPARLKRGESSVIVRSYMAHHQGMSLLALDSLLHDEPMQRRFASDPQCQATLLLLQERVPKTSVFHRGLSPDADGMSFPDASSGMTQVPFGPHTPTPEVNLLSNGNYHLILTNAGGGYSRWRDMAVTRWREDSTCDQWGSFIYLRDLARREIWSATYQPTRREATSYEAVFTEGRAEFRRRDQDIETYTEIVISPEDDIELRRVRVTNRSRIPRTLELTSYAEVVLATPAADMMQPAFGNLFVETEIIAQRQAILCTRRPRSVQEATPWMFHLLSAHGGEISEVSYETDRMRFIGRGRDLSAPQAMAEGATLSGSAGSVLDPIVAIRVRLTLAAEQTITIDWVTGASDSRETCLQLVDKYQDRHMASRVFELAATHGGVSLRQINASEAEVENYRRLAGAVLFAHAAMRADPYVLAENRRGQAGLWGYAISGDLPIVLLKMSDSEHIELARQIIQCHAYWRLRGLAVDLVIWNEDHVGYRQRLQDQIMGLIVHGSAANAIDRAGGIFVRSGEQISHEDRILLQAVARVVISDDKGSLSDQLLHRGLADKRSTQRRANDGRVPRLAPTRTHRQEPPAEVQGVSGMLLGNELGGFSADGREYVIITTAGRTTPAPWVNVLANPHFGSIVTESGGAYTWSENAHEFRLTPWSNDGVGASSGEAFYLRDEESGHYWSPTPLPVRGAMPYRTRHGFGYSVFEHTAGGIHSELWIYVALNDAVKFSVLKVRNGSGRTRRLSATGYVEWVLGDLRPKTAMHVVTAIDAASGALFARNGYNSEFEGRVAFFDVDDLARTLSGDRAEFIGRNGSLAAPEAMRRTRLSGRLGAELDPCGAIQVPFTLVDGEEREIIFRLGAARDLEKACNLAQSLRVSGSARAALDNVRRYWRDTLGTLQVATPDPALDVLANGWLLYQAQACRLWARSGYYQSGGAFGYRDQLQDVMALVYAAPTLVREHLLRSATRQFPEGDVQHWWHPPLGRGVRTRCSDDYLWLPLATCRYVAVTGDRAVLDEHGHFLEGRMLGPDEESYYDLPGQSLETATLYVHCVRAIEHGLRFGARGLPLMGSGDWNDGMNLVGIEGRGESVWLAFFLHEVLSRFGPLADAHGDEAFAERCRSQAALLREQLALHAWDGEWYLRAWFDDGTPLGSHASAECRIDSISQSWSVLSGAGSPERAEAAMAALDQHLVRRDIGIVQLLDPPFDKSDLDPGYIKGYVPGVRENGGQYTHAAVWAAMAFAARGDSTRAWELLEMINPINHARTLDALTVYKTEPYVVTADVYGVAPHSGRGGWSWYTGSASWLYRLMVESLLGFEVNAGRLRLTPCLPASWSGYTLDYRYRDTPHHIEVRQTTLTGDGGASGITFSMDGVMQDGDGLALAEDRAQHHIEIVITRAAAAP